MDEKLIIKILELPENKCDVVLNYYEKLLKEIDLQQKNSS